MSSMKSIAALSEAIFQDRWSREHHDVFAGRELPENPFIRADWRLVCICGPSGYVNERRQFPLDSSDPHDRIYAALIEAIRATGDAELAGCLHDAPHLNDSFFESHVIAPATFLYMRDAALDAYDLHVFGRSGRWGLAICSDEELSVVGGDAAFMQQFIEAAGGEQALCEAFMHCADYLLNFSRPAAEFIERLQALAGWHRAS